MKKINNIRGMYDRFGKDLCNHTTIINKFSNVMERHNYYPFSTPIMEYSNVFKRSLGDTSDVVMKEMYTFLDKSNDSVTLRPEGTAGIARAVISNGLTQSLPLKLYYNGPMFRYERPQKGRMRQFHQIGIENYNTENFYADSEIIYIAKLLLKEFKILDKISLKINTLGDTQSRKNYISKIIQYFAENKYKLSEDSLKRLDKNPLRILDSKSHQDKEVIKNAPIIYDFLTTESKDYYKNLKIFLSELDIEFIEEPLLVRGLDYYCHTIFEFTLNEKQNHAILAGGRYDSLLENLGGPKISGTGWAAGIERLGSILKSYEDNNKILLFIPLEENLLSYCYETRSKIAMLNFKYDILTNFNLKKALKYANKIKAKYAIILGKDEREKNSLTIKNLETGNQETISESKLESYLKNE